MPEQTFTLGSGALAGCAGGVGQTLQGCLAGAGSVELVAGSMAVINNLFQVLVEHPIAGLAVVLHKLGGAFANFANFLGGS